VNDKLIDIKDRKPHEDLVALLEQMLVHAKSGELRSVFATCSYDDNKVGTMWCLDGRTDRRRMLSEVVLGQQELITRISLDDGDTLFARMVMGT